MQLEVQRKAFFFFLKKEGLYIRIHEKREDNANTKAYNLDDRCCL